MSAITSALSRYDFAGALPEKVQEQLSQVMGKAVSNLRKSLAAVTGISKLKKKPAPPATLAANLKILEEASANVLAGTEAPATWAGMAADIARAMVVDALKLEMEDLAIGLESFATGIKGDLEDAAKVGPPKWLIPAAAVVGGLVIWYAIKASKKSALGDEIGPYNFEPEEQLEDYGEDEPEGDLEGLDDVNGG